jgi:hypothetical protein
MNIEEQNISFLETKSSWNKYCSDFNTFCKSNSVYTRGILQDWSWNGSGITTESKFGYFEWTKHRGVDIKNYYESPNLAENNVDFRNAVGDFVVYSQIQYDLKKTIKNSGFVKENEKEKLSAFIFPNKILITRHIHYIPFMSTLEMDESSQPRALIISPFQYTSLTGHSKIKEEVEKQLLVQFYKNLTRKLTKHTKIKSERSFNVKSSS